MPTAQTPSFTAAKARETITIGKRWSWLTALNIEIECDPSLPPRVKLGLAVKVAYKRGADLTDAVLTDAVLTGAVLRGADLRGAVLRGADLRGAVLRDAVLTDAVLTDAVLTDAPKIENIHQAIYAAALAPRALDMSVWHRCGTTHCRAGWVTTLAGEAGAALEEKIGTPAAATLIYLASDPTLERVPDFYCGNGEALADMKRLADAEAVR